MSESAGTTIDQRHPWRRLHPATPLLRGGIFVLAVIGFVLVQFRDLWIGLFVGQVVGEEVREDPATHWILTHGPLAVAILVAALLLVVGFGWLAWRMHDYRVTDELIEEREGVIWRRHRRGRLDRLQGVDVVRPFIPRLFGAARLEISMAGSDGSIKLSYVASTHADELRAEILAAASESRAASDPSRDRSRDRSPSEPEGSRRDDPAPARGTRVGDAIAARAGELLAPELTEPVAPESLVEMHPGRLVGATALRFGPVLVIVLAATIALGILRPLSLLAFIPVLIAFWTVAVREIVRSLRYSIAATPDGIRVGFGLLSTRNETLPPGRIHAVELVQPLLWRPFGWWRVRINRASSSGPGAAGQANTTLLPVGTIEEVLRVVGLVLPGWTEPAAFTTSSERGRWIRWFSWRRNGFAFDERTVVIRRGQLWRTLTLVPLARVQSVGIQDGPLTRAMGLARVDVHTVAGVVNAHVGALDAGDAVGMWALTQRRTLEAMA